MRGRSIGSRLSQLSKWRLRVCRRMLDARTPWVSVGTASRSDDVHLDSTSSSASLLHSIYGSQASQLQFSDYGDSETNLQGARSGEYPPPPPPAGRRRGLNRPKSSPAAVMAAREQTRRQRPGSAVAVQQRGGRGSRPASALPRRPSSALGRPGGLPRARPKTAMGLHRTPQILLEDLEEEGVNPPAIRDISTPVKLTRVPEYLDFWAGKPLVQKEFGVPVHKRNTWQRPKSDYGNRFLKNKGTLGAGGDHMTQGVGAGGLETLIERDDSTLGSEGDGLSRRGSLSIGRDDGGEEQSRLVGEGVGYSEDGEEDRLKQMRDGSIDSRGGKGDSDAVLRDKMKGLGSDGQNQRDAWANKNAAWDKSDGSNRAEDDEFFKKKAMAAPSWMDGGGSSSNSTRFELPMDIKELEAMTPLQYLSKHCIISDRRMKHCSRIFTKLDKDKHRRLNQQLVVGLTEALYHSVSEDQATKVLEIAEMQSDDVVDVKLFAALCCLSERVHNLFYLPVAGREVIEVVDFEALDWKLRDCTISDALRVLFMKL